MLDSPVEGEKTVLYKTTWLLFIWVLWLIWASHFYWTSHLSLHAMSLVLLYGVGVWSIVAGAFICLLMSWIYSALSFTPPGLMWLSLFIVFLVLKLATFRYIVQSPLQLMAAVFLTSLFLEGLQLFFIFRVGEGVFFQWGLVGGILWSSLIQGAVSSLFYKPIKTLVLRT